MTPSQAFSQAMQHHQAARFVEAEALYRQVLAAEPAHADAMHMLGIVAHQTGRSAQAGELIRGAIRIKPRVAAYHTNLGAVLAEQALWDDAATAFRTAIALDPRSPESHNNLGNVLKELGRPAEAIDAYRQAIALRPAYPDACYNLGTALYGAMRLDEAIDAFRQALKLRPAYPAALNNLGNALRDRGRFEEAVAEYHRAVALKPDFAEAWSNLGNTLKDVGTTAEATNALKRALALKPDSPDIHNNLGNLFRQQDQLDQSIAHLRQALKLRPDFAEALTTLGGALKDSGRLPEAIDCFRQSLAVHPTPQAADNLLFALHHDPDCDARQLNQEHASWNRQFAQPLTAQRRSHANDRNPNRRLRIGYVSPDLGDHPVGRFLVPLLQNHDHDNFEIFCYTDTLRADAVTDQLRSCTDTWRSTMGLNDEEAAAIVRQDQIDVLVDLAMHTRHNRLLMFARKPAPVQTTYLAYSGTTGLATMDYRLTDPYLDPPGIDETAYAEKTIRLPNTFWCYQAPVHAPAVTEPPALATKHITFGCFNQYAKVTQSAWSAWRAILRRTPESRLIVHAAQGAHRQAAKDRFAKDAIDPARLQFADRVPTPRYFAQYNSIDVALDTFPYPGGTTTCDALWMGVPVVCRPGPTAISRGGLSVLSNVGLPELATTDLQRYIDIAVGLAQNVPRLATLRASMRDRMLASPLMDAPRFARDVEATYRVMWRQYCQSNSRPAQE